MREGKKGIAVLLFAIVGFSQSGCLIGLVGLGMAPLVGGRSPDSERAAFYTPTVRLSESPKTIEANVKLEPFINRIPITDSKSKRGDHEIPGPGSMEGELTELVRQAILADFRTNLVFANVRIHEDHPELVIRGLIQQFAEYHTRPWYGKIPLVGNLVGAGEQVEGGVELLLTVSTPTGEPIGTYQGQSTFPDANTTDSDKEKKRRPQPPGERLNRAFSEAVHQIRQQMLADQKLVNGEWRKKDN